MLAIVRLRLVAHLGIVVKVTLGTIVAIVVNAVAIISLVSIRSWARSYIGTVISAVSIYSTTIVICCNAVIRIS